MKSLVQRAALIGLPALLAASGASMAAGRDYDSDDLKGDYYCNVIEVHRFTNPAGLAGADRCNYAGLVHFDGAGTMQGSGNMRCSAAGTAGPFSITNHYALSPDGSFLFSDFADLGNPSHGQIVDHGRALLLDGTMKTFPEILSWSGICMRP